jgi:hypothetical protein
MEQGELIRRMWGRVELCRKLAITTTDPQTADALIEMANEGEADIKRMLSERKASAGAPLPPLARPPAG